MDKSILRAPSVNMSLSAQQAVPSSAAPQCAVNVARMSPMVKVLVLMCVFVGGRETSAFLRNALSARSARDVTEFWSREVGESNARVVIA